MNSLKGQSDNLQEPHKLEVRTVRTMVSGFGVPEPTPMCQWCCDQTHRRPDLNPLAFRLRKLGSKVDGDGANGWVLHWMTNANWPLVIVIGNFSLAKPMPTKGLLVLDIAGRRNAVGHAPLRLNLLEQVLDIHGYWWIWILDIHNGYWSCIATVVVINNDGFIL